MSAELVVQPTKLIVNVNTGLASDTQELAGLSDGLRTELIEVGVESVEHARESEAPVGSKGDALTLSTLVVTLVPTALTGLIAMLQSWLTRHERTTLTLQKADQKITVTGTLSKEQEQVIRDWLSE